LRGISENKSLILASAPTPRIGWPVCKALTRSLRQFGAAAPLTHPLTVNERQLWAKSTRSDARSSMSRWRRERSFLHFLNSATASEVYQKNNIPANKAISSKLIYALGS